MRKKKLSKEEIVHLANLSSLKLTEDEINKFSEQLTETVDYVNNLNELNTENVSPTYQVTKLENIYFDEDISKNQRSLSLEEIFLNTKNKKNNYFIVKRIL